MCIGLFIATVLETLQWSRYIARLAAPVARTARLQEEAAAAFSLAFFSPAGANALLAEARARGALSVSQLVLSNLFNSTPAFLVHLPSLFALLYAFLGNLAFTYTGLTLAAALLRTVTVVIAGRILLSPPLVSPAGPLLPKDKPLAGRDLIRRVWKRFSRRLRRVLLYTVPLYCLMVFLQQAGFFTAAEIWMSEHGEVLSFLSPQALSIAVLHLAADTGAALAAAASFTAAGDISNQEIILALLVGSMIAAPLRAVRHQFPSYAGYFCPGTAALLVCMNQIWRMLSLAAITAAYYFWVRQ